MGGSVEMDVHKNCVQLNDILLTAIEDLWENLIIQGLITLAENDSDEANIFNKRRQTVEFLFKYYQQKSIKTEVDSSPYEQFGEANSFLRCEEIEQLEINHQSTTNENHTVAISETVDRNSTKQRPRRSPRSPRRKRKKSQPQKVVSQQKTKSSNNENESYNEESKNNCGLEDSVINLKEETCDYVDTVTDPTEYNHSVLLKDDVKSDKELHSPSEDEGGYDDMDGSVTDNTQEIDENFVVSGSDKNNTAIKLSIKRKKKKQNRISRSPRNRACTKRKNNSNSSPVTKSFKEENGNTTDTTETIEVEEDDDVNYVKVPESDLTTSTNSHSLYFRVKNKKPFLYMCRVCGHHSTRKDSMVQHVRNHTGERPFKCSMCDKAYNTNSHLARHIIIHTPTTSPQISLRKKNFKCDVCNKAYDCRYKLTEHSYIHTGEKPNNCLKCDFKTRRGKSLLEHMVAKHGQGPRKQHACDQCNKSYLSRHSLKLHQSLVHDPIKKAFVCEVCGKNFKTWPTLKEHYLCHSDKLYECKYCKFKTNRPKYFRLHEANHGMKTRQCEICGKGLSSLAALQNHLKVIHGPGSEECKSYSCRFCGVTYTNKQSMNSHMRKHKSKVTNKTITDTSQGHEVLEISELQNNQHEIYSDNKIILNFEESDITTKSPEEWPDRNTQNEPDPRTASVIVGFHSDINNSDNGVAADLIEAPLAPTMTDAITHLIQPVIFL